MQCVDSLVIHPVRRPINAESFGILYPPEAKGVVPSTPASYAVPTPVIAVLTPRAIDERLTAFVAFPRWPSWMFPEILSEIRGGS